jgi:hypothetical protein
MPRDIQFLRDTVYGQTMMNPGVAALIDELRRDRFRDLAGARVSAQVPVSRLLLNRIVAGALRGSNEAVRHIDVQPLPGDSFAVAVSLKWALIPSITVTLDVERQPVFPDSPVLVLRWSLPAGLGTIAAQFVSRIKSLPHGVQLERDRLLLDLRRLAERSPAAELLPYIGRGELHTISDAAIVEIDLRVTP